MRQGVAHHGPALGIPCILPGLRRSPIHLLDAAEPSISIEGLANRDAVRTEQFPPLLLDVESHLGPLDLRLDGQDKLLLELGEGPGFVGVDDAARRSAEGLLAKVGVLHLLGQPRLLALEHVAQEFVQLGLLLDGKLAGAELGDEDVAVGHLLRRPASRPPIGRISKGMVGILVLVPLALPPLLGRGCRHGSAGLVDLGKVHGDEGDPLWRCRATDRTVLDRRIGYGKASLDGWVELLVECKIRVY